ncbi:hypothetical protein [Motilimonas sp. E26]|uniref:hypothetical protein n=1 Tax=Motilimonas TaxID=1914248 RepID=UPI001E567499|nr:hypothetical protein [Motilimonas sp. E26]MCE0559103.1 hypothetical protein [Motilimonas sp. E26]
MITQQVAIKSSHCHDELSKSADELGIIAINGNPISKIKNICETLAIASVSYSLFIYQITLLSTTEKTEAKTK